ncbi:MAG: Kaumoebavirus [Bacteroidota bacterium]|jgi:tRNA uridine 5-carbamoylmethylation protein Kti12
MKKIVNIVGMPGCGKSSTSCELFVCLKKRHIETEYVNEFVKTLVWEEKFDIIDDQYYVARKQYQIIKSVIDKVEVAICDSPLFISLFYNEHNTENVSNVEKTKNFILNKMKEFEENSYYIFIKRNNTFPYSNVGRIHGEDEAKIINNKMKKLLDYHKIKYLEYCPGIDDISKILKYVGYE